MSQLTPQQVARYESKFVQAYPSTRSNGQPIPSYEDAVRKGQYCMLVGLLDMFGIKKYYDVNSQSDIQHLVRSCMNGASMDVQWFFLKHEDLAPEDGLTMESLN